MAEETTPPESTDTPAGSAETDDQRVPYERFQSANKKAKEAADRAKALERDMADLKAQLEERENAGLPELDQMRRQLEKAQQRAEAAEQRASEQENQMALNQRERWVAAAANKLNFVDPDDASRFLNLADIEDAKDAERAVKRLAGDKKHLLKADEPNVPGRVLENGRPSAPVIPGQAAPGSAMGLVPKDQEAAALGAQLTAFLESRKASRMTFDA